MPATTVAGSSNQYTRSLLSPSALCHVVLRTTAENYETMVNFYLTILGGRISHKTHRLCFLAFDDEHHRIAILIDPAAYPQTNNRKNVGLHHVAFGFRNLSNLVTSYEEKKAVGMLPVWCVNHGMTTSMYYEDPDGNQVEFQVDSFDTAEEAVVFMNSPAFEENPVGVDFDPDVFTVRYIIMRIFDPDNGCGDPGQERTANLESILLTDLTKDKIMSPAPFQNLIRFLDEDLVEHYGSIDSALIDNIVGSKAHVLEGDLLDLKKTDKVATVKKLLSPVQSTPIFVCIGLNYADHAVEANLQIPPNPVIFTKPADALGSPDSDITIPKHASLLDYEGELCIVISRTGKDISEDEAYDYILGYTVGNDISSRYWQRPPYSGGQFCYAKSFDGFAPIGPTLLHPSFAPRGSVLEIKTTVNGQIRQKATTQDMLFSIEKIISHCSRGTTLRAGTIIMTGTPAGIAAKIPGSPWLKNGDIVEVEVDRIGRLRNRIVSPYQEN